MTLQDCENLGKWHRLLAERLTRTSVGEWLTTVLQFESSAIWLGWTARKTDAYNRGLGF